jgi:BED zinc finger.
MSQSQTSFYAESFIGSDLLQSDNLPDIPSSQPTVDSFPTSRFTQHPQLSLAPTSFPRVGPNFRKFWILYNSDAKMDESRSQFVRWWLTTGFGLDPLCRDGIHWEKKKKSDAWDHFEQVAHERTGEPKVACKHCSTVLAHPNYKRAGTSAMKTHLKGNTCRIDKKAQGPPINQMIRDMVCSEHSILLALEVCY